MVLLQEMILAAHLKIRTATALWDRTSHQVLENQLDIHTAKNRMVAARRPITMVLPTQHLSLILHSR
jgi:hypothetical protein